MRVPGKAIARFGSERPFVDGGGVYEPNPQRSTAAGAERTLSEAELLLLEESEELEGVDALRPWTSTWRCQIGGIEG